MAYALREHPAIRELNVTPQIDVLLVLLVVFLLASPPLLHRLDVTLPPPTPPQSTPPPERIVLTLAVDGRLHWNGVALPSAALAPQLAIEARRTPQPIVAIDVDPGARFEHVTGLLSLAQAAGMRSVGFIENP